MALHIFRHRAADRFRYGNPLGAGVLLERLVDVPVEVDHDRRCLLHFFGCWHWFFSPLNKMER
jgi:hypothetical protein